MPDGFKGQPPFNPAALWFKVQELWDEAERITYENTPVTPEDAAVLRAWINGRPSS